MKIETKYNPGDEVWSIYTHFPVCASCGQNKKEQDLVGEMIKMEIEWIDIDARKDNVRISYLLSFSKNGINVDCGSYQEFEIFATQKEAKKYWGWK